MTEYHIRRRHRWLCRRKIKYDDPIVAQDVLFEMQARPRTYLANELVIYVCRACGFMHIGHRPDWKANGKRETNQGARGRELAAAKLALNRSIRAVPNSSS